MTQRSFLAVNYFIFIFKKKFIIFASPLSGNIFCSLLQFVRQFQDQNSNKIQTAKMRIKEVKFGIKRKKIKGLIVI